MKACQTFLPGLYIVATPIGNLGDITLRALDALRAADVVACEDTRVTGKLLSHFGIKARMISYHDHSRPEVAEDLLSLLRAGQRVMLLSDAGTPLISDPGYRLVRAARDEGIAVVPLPGSSALIAALCACGLPTDRFFFAGFLPPKAAARARAIAELAVIPATLVFYESVHRLPESVRALAEGLGCREATVARELTKLHEEFRRATLAELAAHYEANGEPKGECVIVVAPPKAVAVTVEDAETLLREALESLSVRDAATKVATITGLPRNELYALALKLKQSL